MRKLFAALALLLITSTAYSADFYTAATATEQVRNILLEKCNGYFTDTEIQNWIKEAVEDISARSLCIQVSDLISLVTSTYEYTTTDGAVSVADMVKVWGAFYLNPDDEYIGLERIEPAQISTLTHMKGGPPKYYYHFAGKIGILPVPTSGENGDDVRIYFSKESQTIGDLPNEYQSLTFWYAASMAHKKMGNAQESERFYGMYLDKLNSLRSDLYNVKPDVPNK